ncbi:MAG: hypothetical protein N2316_07900, partial [Spirochaetes bacterium]|nr:hypothetical protein [Spirochaetota bacterium]
YKTSALTQPVMGQGNDGNEGMYVLTNYIKLYFGDDDQGYILIEGLTPRMSAELHSEAVRWFFKSIERNQDWVDTIPVGVDGQDTLVGFSARSKVGALWNRLNSIYGNPSGTWRWIEQHRGQKAIGGNTYQNNKSISTADDVYQFRNTTSGTGNGNPGM